MLFTQKAVQRYCFSVNNAIAKSDIYLNAYVNLICVDVLILCDSLSSLICDVDDVVLLT